MKTNTLAVAEAHAGMMQVRLSRTGTSTEYSLVRQDGMVILGPCVDEAALEGLALRYAARQRQSQQLRSLGRSLAIAAFGLAVCRG